MEKKTTVLMILDGFGLNDKAEGNAVKLAKTPVLDGLMQKYPFVQRSGRWSAGRADGKFRGWASEYGRRACRLSGADTHHKGD